MADWSSYLSSAGSLLGGVGSFIGGLFGSDNDTYEDQRALMAENNRFQAEENEKSRKWQQSLYDRQWQDYMDYNDPSALVQRLQSAGVSPASAFQSMSTSGTVSSMPSPSSPGHSAVPSPDYAGSINPINQKAAAFSSISQGLQALANARKIGIEGSFVGSQMQAYIKSLMSESDYKDVLADQQKYEVELRRKYGDKMLNAQVYELAMKAFQEEQLAKFYIRQENVQEAEAALNRAKEDHERVLKRLSGAQAEQYEIDNRFREAYNQASINELKSRSSMQSEQAGYYRESGQLIASQKAAQDMANEVREFGLNDEKAATLSSWIMQAAVSDEKRQAAFNELLKLQKIATSYQNSDSKLKADAALKVLFDLIGFGTNISVGAHN